MEFVNSLRCTIIRDRSNAENRYANNTMHKRLEALRAYFAQQEAVILAYLFGSQATGKAGPTSDYDIGVLVETPSVALMARLGHEIGGILETNCVDVVLLNWAPIELAYAVIAQGELLYQRCVAERVEFEARVLSLYGDYLPILRQQREEILKEQPGEAGIRRYREALRRTERTLAALRAAASQTD